MDINSKDKIDYWDKRFTVSKINPHKVQTLLKRLFVYGLFDANILEYGCGTPWIASVISNLYMCKSYTLADISENAIEQAKKFCPRAKTLLVEPWSSLDVPDNSFDVLFLFDVLEHLNPHDGEREFICKMLQRVMVEKALIIINNPMGVSKHDTKFDFGGLSEREVYDVSCWLNADTVQKERYSAFEREQFEFIAMVKRGRNGS